MSTMVESGRTSGVPSEARMDFGALSLRSGSFSLAGKMGWGGTGFGAGSGLASMMG